MKSLRLSLLVLASVIVSLAYGQNAEFLVKDINSGPDGSYPNHFLELGSHIYFVVYNGPDAQIWRTVNGRAADTELVIGGFEQIDRLERVMGQLFFAGQQTATGDYELWRHSGTPNDPLTKIDVKTNGSGYPYSYVKAGSRIYFLASTTTAGTQICSVAPNSNTVQVHTAPPPYNTGLFAFSPRSVLNTGVDALVPTTTHLFVATGGPNPAALLALDLSNALATPVIVGSQVSNYSDGMAPVGNKVCYNRSTDLLCADATGITTVATGINPTYPTAFGGKLYFAGLRSAAGPALSVLYSYDGVSPPVEHANIPVQGAVGSTNATLWSIQPNVVPGQLVAWLNDFPVSTVFALHTIDVSGVPTATLASVPIPSRMFDIAYIDNHFYYQHVPWQSNDLQFLKCNANSSSVLGVNQNDDAYGTIKAFPSKQMILYGGSQSSESFDCSTGGTAQLGPELYKLNHYQTDCQQVVNVTAADIALGDVIVAGQEINITGNASLTSNLCTPLVAPLVNIVGSLNIVPPSQISTYNGGCP